MNQMGRTRFFLFSILTVLPVISCVRSQPQPSPLALEKEDPLLQRDIELALKAIDQGKFREALSLLREAELKSPPPNFRLVIDYNTGVSYEGLKDCEQADKSYAGVLKALPKGDDRIRIQALYRRGITLECLGDVKSAIIHFQEALSKKESLPESIGEAELPARMSSAYARLGLMEQARKHLLLAEEGIQSASERLKNSAVFRETMARMLFVMGSTPTRTASRNPDFESGVRGLYATKSFLVRAIALEDPEWSEKALSALKEEFDIMFNQVDRHLKENVNSPTAIEGARRSYLSLDLTLTEILNLKIPGEAPSTRLSTMFSWASSQRKRISDALTSLPESTIKTSTQRSAAPGKQGTN